MERIPLFKPHMPPAVMAPLQGTLLSGYIGEGPRVREFETRLGEYLGNAQVLALNSGTSALQLALRLADVGPGAEVISTPMTCVATNQAILASGADIVWADVDPSTGNLLPSSVQTRISPRTRAIMVVHWGGSPVDLAGFATLADTHAIPVIEDAAHALGAEYQRRRIGGHSEFVCFSFQAIKHITTVDGGALCCRSTAATERGRRLRWYGMDRTRRGAGRHWQQDVAEYGYKIHMNDVAATLGLVQLGYLESILAYRRELAAHYRRELKAVPGLALPDEDPNARSAYWLFTVLVEDRDNFVRHMAARGIETSQVHARNDTYTLFAASRTELPGVDAFAARMVCIPIGFWVGADEQARIIDAIKAGW